MNLMKVFFNLSYIFSYTISGDIMPRGNFNMCESCLDRQSRGENIACPLECNTLMDLPCRLCPPDPLCPPPGPDCNYVKERDNCGCLRDCGEIVCGSTSNTPPPPPIPCAIQQIDCINEFVCPKITEVTHCTEGGIQGHTTYQISVILDPNKHIQNIYALFGDNYNHLMYLPPAYQIDGPFDSNIGGVSPSIISIFPDSLYDSWMTIGITDGDKDNKLSTIGIDFNEWSEINSITTSNGAVFLLDPNEYSNENRNRNEYIIGQLTLKNDLIDVLTVNIQGKLENGETWQEYGVNFIFNPSELIQNNIPNGCSIWFDGCNLCHVNLGELGVCTKNMCFTEDEPECRVYESDLSGH